MHLQELGLLHETDKAADDKHFQGFGYLDIYERYLDPRRNKIRKVLELGVKDGASLKMWRDYFPQAQIFGIDIDPETKRDYGERVEVITASQDDPEAFTNLSSLDLVIDDASHVNELTLASWKLLWPKIVPGGLYIFEDLGVSYHRTRRRWPGMSYNRPDLNLTNQRGLIDEHFQRMLLELDHRRGDVLFVHFWSMVAIMQKVGEC